MRKATRYLRVQVRAVTRRWAMWKMRGHTFYREELGKFVHVHGVRHGNLLCGALTDYYSDARTNVTRLTLSLDYIQACKRVEAIDKFPEVAYDGIGWRK